MRRMIPSPRKVIECSFENDGRTSNVYVPLKSINDLPVSFDLILSDTRATAHIIAWFSPYNGETYAGASFVIPEDNNGNISITAEPGSLFDPGMPYLELYLSYEDGGIQTPPISVNNRVFVTNITPLEKGVIEIYK